MASKFGSWWKKTRFSLWLQKIKQQPVRMAVIIGAGVLGIMLLVAFIGGYFFHWDWTGFSSYTPPIKDSNFQRGKTLWDWLGLLAALAIPAVVGLGTVWFTSRQALASDANRAQQARESEANREKRHQTDLEIAEKNRERQQQTDLQIAADNQQEAALQNYLDNMSDLLLNKSFRQSIPGDEVRSIARTRTLTVLSRLNGMRKRSVLQFLYESGLITKGKRVIDLIGADLSEASLRGTDLHGASLVGSNLHEADLRGANLEQADLSAVDLHKANMGLLDSNSTTQGYPDPRGTRLSEAILNSADLSEADLRSANLRGASIERAKLDKADLRQAILYSVKLEWASLIETNLSGASLGGANLNGANLSKANLRGARLPSTSLTGGSYIQGSEKAEYDPLEERLKCGANLEGADLDGADLSGADLSGAYLKDAIVSSEQLNIAKSLQGTIMPDGKTHP